MGHFFQLQKEALIRYLKKELMRTGNGICRRKRGPYQTLIGAFIRGEKGQL